MRYIIKGALLLLFGCTAFYSVKYAFLFSVAGMNGPCLLFTFLAFLSLGFVVYILIFRRLLRRIRLHREYHQMVYGDTLYSGDIK